MSAIFAIYQLDERPVSQHDLERMAGIMAHRGPDDSKLWLEHNVGLGHRMLWTTPESLDERLPRKDTASNLAITADARLDNRDDLIARLQGDTRITDSELILRAYERWGDDCVQYLLGDFVFVIWDARRQKMFCARDHFGVKHFCYYYRPRETFVLASEIKALMTVLEVPPRLNELIVADNLLPIFEDRESTLYEGVLRLPAAHTMTVSREGLSTRRYWSPDLAREVRYRTNEEYEDNFRELFTEAVRCRLRSAFPVGSMLSGGLDSSSISCVAGKIKAQQGGPPLHTFSGIFPGLVEASPAIDERRYVNAVLASGEFQPHFVPVDNISPLTDIDKILWHLDNSLPAANMYMDWAIFKSAAQEGVRTIFSGNDGDTIVSYGHNDLSDFLRRGWLRTFTKETIALHRGRPFKFRKFKKFLSNFVFGPVIHPMIPEWMLQVWRALHGRPRHVPEPDQQDTYWSGRPICKNFARRIDLSERFWRLQNASFAGRMTTRELQWFGVSSGLNSFLVETYEKAAGAFGIEPRHPFFDRRLVEFCLALPPGQRLQNGWTRSIFRRAMNGILPPEVQWRKDKSNLSAGITLGLIKFERETLERVLLREPEGIRDYIDIPALETVYLRYLERPMEHLEDGFSIQLIANMALWLRHIKKSINNNYRTTEPALSLIDS